MNKKKFHESLTVSTESHHKVIGLNNVFKWHFSITEPFLDIYYKDILLRHVTGDEAIEIYREFDKEAVKLTCLKPREVKQIAECSCGVSELAKVSRKTNIVVARGLFYKYMKHYYPYLSYEELGEYNNQHRSTVMYALNKMDNEYYITRDIEIMKNDFLREINRIHEDLKIPLYGG